MDCGEGAGWALCWARVVVVGWVEAGRVAGATAAGALAAAGWGVVAMPAGQARVGGEETVVVED